MEVTRIMKNKIMILSLAAVLVIGFIAYGAIYSKDEAEAPKEVKTKPVTKASIEEINSLYFDYDEEKYELIQVEGENLISLMDKETNSNVFISWSYIPDKNMKTAAEEKKEEIEGYEGFTASIEEAGLDIPAIKLVDYYEEDDSSTSFYYVEDNEGGVYKVFVNTMVFDAFADENELEEILKSIKVVPKNDNINLKKIRLVKRILR